VTALISLLALGTILGGCSRSVRRSEPAFELVGSRNDQISGPGYSHFVNANLLELFGSYPEAITEYKNALQYFPESATIRTDYARLLFRMSYLPEALNQAQLINPKTSEVYLLIGDCYRLLDSLPSAITYYHQATALDPDNINAFWYLAGYYQQNAQEDSVIWAYYQLARLSDTYRIWHELGTMLGKAARYPEALEAFQKSIALNTDKSNINAYLGLAATYEALDSIPRAEDILAQAAALDEYDVRVYRQMLMMYLAREDIVNSIRAAEKLVTLDPSDWMAQRRLGILLYSDNRLAQADSLFASRIASGDDNALNYFYRGRVAVEQQRFAEAKAFFLTVTQKEETFADGWLNLGYVCSQQDSLPVAIELYRHGLEVCATYDDTTRLYFALGSALERNGQIPEAISAFKELLAIDEENAPALNYLGYMLADRGEQLNYALELIQRALKASPDNAAYIDSYGWVQFKLGNFEPALTELKRAAELLTNDAIIYEHIGDVYKAMGNMSEAERNYRRALELDANSLRLEEKMKQ
jgi:tetratricopeptide (TPR) repeat protein